MIATSTPKATADEARETYRQTTAKLGQLGLDTAIPESVRSMAENSVDQTRAMTVPPLLSTFSSQPSRGRSTLPARAPSPSTARSSTSPGAT
jgi:hypothetical protein